MNTSDEGLTVRTGRLFSNRNFIFTLAIVLGLALGQGAALTKPLILPAIAVNMTLSTISITNRDLTSIKNAPRPILISLLLNYLVLGGVMILLTNCLISDVDLRAGFIILAVMPPAIAIVPFNYMLGGDMVFSLIGTTGLNLIALALTPGLMMLLLGADFISPLSLLLSLVELIVVPLAVSRLLLRRGLAGSIAKWRDTAVNWCFFVVLFTVIGLNRQVLFEQPALLRDVIIINAAVTFGLGHVIDFITRKLRMAQPRRISLILMGNHKNMALASVIALTFLGEKASFPSAIAGLVGMLSIVWWGIYFKKRAK